MLFRSPFTRTSITVVCPADIEVLVNGAECGEGVISWPAEISVKVLSESGAAMQGVPVGIAALPADSHGLAHWYSSGLSSENGVFSSTVESPGEEQSGGVLQIQAADIRRTCLIP